jgi:hypothetical protein
MAKGDHAKRARSAGKADAATTAKPAAPTDDKAAKADRRLARKIVKVEVQLADAREIRAAVEALVGSLERKLAELQAAGHPAPPPAKAATTAAKPATPRAAATPRARRTAASKPRVVRTRRPRKATPPA